MRNPGCTWILVADGRRARVFEEVRRGAALSEREDAALALHPTDLETPTDRPPRVFDRMGEHRHAMEAGGSPHARAEAAFLARVCAAIDSAHRAGAFQSLVVIAPPRAMGALRAGWSERVHAAIAHEDAKERVDADAAAIGEALKALRLP
ncbi:MAG: hypothetical protein GC189_03720 [Alphaproteobacteria bacterium]|nr:hypothetical protein [Alphaproteobacteria bacterium]